MRDILFLLGVDFSVRSSTHHSSPWQTFGPGCLCQQPPERNELLHRHDSILSYSCWQQLWTWDNKKRIMAPVPQMGKHNSDENIFLMSHVHFVSSSTSGKLPLKRVWLFAGFGACAFSGEKKQDCLHATVGIGEIIHLTNWYLPVFHFLGPKHSPARKLRANHWCWCTWMKVAVLQTPSSWHIITAVCSLFFLPHVWALPESCCISPWTSPGSPFSPFSVNVTATHHLHNLFYFCTAFPFHPA